MFGISTIRVFLYFLFFLSFISVSIYIFPVHETTVKSYFFADEKISWLLLGISFITGFLFFPYICGILYLGFSIAVPIVYGIISVIMLFIMGRFLAPLYLKAKIKTLPEYFERRFNRECRLLTSTLYLVFNIFTRLLIILILVNIFLRTLTGADAYFTILFLLIISNIYLIIGGMNAEIYMSIVQVFFFVIGIAGIIVWVLSQGKGFYAGDNAANLLWTGNSEFVSSYSWKELILGLPAIIFWFCCADQIIVQKILSARNALHVRKASVVSMFSQSFVILGFIIPVIIVSALFPDISYGKVLDVFFNGDLFSKILSGGLILAMASVLMSAFDSLYSSTSALVTFDFYNNFKPEAEDKSLVLVGRLTMLALLFLSILLLPVSENLGLDICLKLFDLFTYFISLLSAVFLIGLLSKKIKASSAFLTLCFVSVIILLRSGYEFFCYNSSLNIASIDWLGHTGFLEFSIFIFILSIASLFVINMMNFSRLISNTYIKNLKHFFFKLGNERNVQKKDYCLSLFMLLH